LKELIEAIDTIKVQVDEVLALILVIQAENDNIIDPHSAKYIYDHVDSDDKNIKWYSESGHVITIDKEKEQVFEDIYQFLDSLD
ncbi:carboxylesterase, partial [Staphylococcus aureus]|uniref:alpha/beta hydrolase n=1 Tax=Staphylococcus aureus TaxID=1280 RepID=UPI00065BB00D